MSCKNGFSMKNILIFTLIKLLKKKDAKPIEIEFSKFDIIFISIVFIFLFIVYLLFSDLSFSECLLASFFTILPFMFGLCVLIFLLMPFACIIVFIYAILSGVLECFRQETRKGLLNKQKASKKDLQKYEKSK